MSPAGAAIMTGSNFPINRLRTAELMGFIAPLKNTHDAILSSDDLLEGAAVLAILNASLGRWAEDIILWFTSEFRFIDIPDRFCGTSSIMPQKRNPVSMGLIKGAFANAVGSLVTGFMAEKDPTGFPVDHRYQTDALWQTSDNSIRNLRWLQDLIPNMKVNTEL